MTLSPTFVFKQHGQQLQFCLPDANDHIQKQIRLQARFYEQAMLDDISPKIREGGCVVDVGANIGNHTIYFSKILGLPVVAFEPNPKALVLLRQNITLNKLDHLVDVHDVALGASDSIASVLDEDPHNLGRASVKPAGCTDTIVQVRRLADVMGSRTPALIKIDVEGMEPDVLQGAVPLLQRDRPLLLIEAATYEQLLAVEALTRPLGYRCIAVYNDTPTYLFQYQPPRTGRAVDQLPPYIHSCLPQTDRIVAGMATVKGNEVAMQVAVTSLLHQVDHLYLYLNHYETVPDCLARFDGRITCILDTEGTSLGDAGKFAGVTQEPHAIFLTCDDDIAYPSDYVMRMAQELAVRGGSEAIGVHASILMQPAQRYYDNKTRYVLHFEQALLRRRRVHVLGTGTVAFHTDLIAPRLSDFPSPNMADLWFTLWLQARDTPLIAAPRPAGWLQSIPVTRQTIYDASHRNRGGSFDTSVRQDEVMHSMMPMTIHKETGHSKGLFLIELHTHKDIEDLLETCARQHRDAIIVLVESSSHAAVNTHASVRLAPSCETHWLPPIPEGQPIGQSLPITLCEALESNGTFLELHDNAGHADLQVMSPQRISMWRKRMRDQAKS